MSLRCAYKEGEEIEANHMEGGKYTWVWSVGACVGRAVLQCYLYVPCCAVLTNIAMLCCADAMLCCAMYAVLVTVFMLVCC
jgi:hypothetical protein